MIYLDTSVALAQLFAEDRRPAAALWGEPLVSSRLLEFEVWTRVHARGLGASHAELVRGLLSRVAMLEMSTTVLSRALDAFPIPVRTLDAIHLASMAFLVERGQALTLATYDERLRDAAEALGITKAPHGA